MKPHSVDDNASDKATAYARAEAAWKAKGILPIGFRSEYENARSWFISGHMAAEGFDE